MDPAMATAAAPAYGERPEWGLGRPKIRPFRLLLAWAISALALVGAAWLVPGASVNDYRGALVAAAVIAVLNAILPPLVAALRLPFVALLGFLAGARARRADAARADRITDGDLSVDSFWSALLRRARRPPRSASSSTSCSGRTTTTRTRCRGHAADRPSLGRARTATDAPGIVFLEIDGLALPVLQRAMRDGNAPDDGALAAEDGATASSSGRPTSRRRPARARPASCSARTRTSPPSAGSRRRRRR